MGVERTLICAVCRLEVLCSTEMINVKTICELWDFEPKKLAKICTQAWQGNFPNLVLAAGTVAKAVSAFIEFQTDAASLIRGDDRLSGEIGLKRVDTSDVLVGALKKELRGLTDTVAKLNARLMDSIDNCDSDTTVDDIVEKIRYYCDSLTKMVNGLDEDIDAIIVDCTKIAILLGAIHDLFLAARHCDCSQASCVHGSSATDCKHRNMTFPRYSVGRIVGLEMAKESEVGSRVRSRNETVVMFLSADRT